MGPGGFASLEAPGSGWFGDSFGGPVGPWFFGGVIIMKRQWKNIILKIHHL